MTRIPAGPVIRADEQLVMICSQDFAHRPNKRWHGTLELERREYATYADILHAADDDADTIMKVLRVCMSDGSIEDITDDVIEFARGVRFGRRGAAA